MKYLVVCLLFLLACEKKEDQYGVLAGEVYYGASIPAEEAVVSISSSGNQSNVLIRLLTGEDGRFQIILEEGTYYLQALFRSGQDQTFRLPLEDTVLVDGNTNITLHLRVAP